MAGLKLGIDVDDLMQGLSNVEKSLRNLGSNVDNMGKRLTASVEQSAIQSISATRKMTDEMNGQFSSLYNSLSQLSQFKGVFTEILGVAGISASIMGFTKQIVDVRSEFQNTEAMFKVFLGDTEKAAAFMKEMEDYAYNNVFEFSDLTKQAAQLLAYKTDVEDVTDVLDRLSNVAAGTNTNLAELVSVYNKVKANNSMDSNAVASFSNKGIDIYSVLAEKRGQSRASVKATTLEFKDLQEALNAVTDEGGMFYGMMTEKMKTLGDSIGLLQDNVTLMFNEIGKGLQDDMRSAIYGAANAVEWLTENYRTIGEVMVTLIATYGTYKAVVALTTVIERVHAKVMAEAVIQKKLAAASNITLSNSEAIAAARQALFTSAVKANTAAAIKNAAAWLANPAVAITAAVVGLGVAMYSVHKIITDETTAEERLNEELGKRYAVIDEATSKADEYIAKIFDEKTSVDELTASYQELSKYLSKSEAEIQNMSREELEKEVEKKDSSEKQKVRDDKKNELMSSREKLSNALQSTSGRMKSGQELVVEKMVIDQIKVLDEQIAALGKKEALDVSSSINKQNVSLEEKKRIIEETAKANNEYLKSLQNGTGEYIMAEAAAKEYEEQIKAIDDAIEKAKKKTAENSASQDKAYWEKQKKDAQSDINAMTTGELQTEEGRKKKSDAQQKINEANQKLKLYDIVDIEKQTKAIKDLEEKVANERLAVEKKRIKDKHKLIDMDLEQTLKSIDKEEQEFNKNNGGSTSSSRSAFNDRRNIVRLAAEFDHAQADKDFAEWERTFTKETENVRFDIDIANLQKIAELTDDITKKLEIQQRIREKTLKQQLDAIEEEKRNTIKKEQGEEELNNYIAGKSVSDTTSKISAKYDDRKKAITEQSVAEGTAEKLSQELSAYKSYAEELVRIEQWEKEQINKIDGANEDDIKQRADNQRKMAKMQYGVTGDDISEFGIEGVSSFTDIINQVLGQSQDVIVSYYETVKGELDRIIEEEKTKVDSLTSERADLESQENANQDEINSIDAQLETETDEQRKVELESRKNALLSQSINIKEKIKAKDKEIADASNKIVKAQTSISVLGNKVKTSINQGFDANNAQKMTDKLSKTVTTLTGIKSAIDTVADSFDGMFSEAGGDAMNVMKVVMDSSIGVITAVLSASQAGVEGTKMMENASVILAVISAAIAVINAVVNAILKNVSKSAILKKEIEAYTENVKELEREHKELERIYNKSEGTEYYKNQIKLANDLNRSIEEQEIRLQKARELQDEQESSHGEDSDKAKEAKQQVTDFEEELAQTREDQYNTLDELYKELATTDLSSFAESLAESMVEGFENGLNGMSDAFDKKLDELIKSMMVKELSIQLQDNLKGAFANLKTATKDGLLSREEIDTFKAEVEAGKEQAMRITTLWTDAMKEAGIYDDAKIESESKGFNAMSQDTGDELNGRFTALQMSGASIQSLTSTMSGTIDDIRNANLAMISNLKDMVERQMTIRDVIDNQMSALNDIRNNTSVLRQIDARLRSIEENTGRL